MNSTNGLLLTHIVSQTESVPRGNLLRGHGALFNKRRREGGILSKARFLGVLEVA